MNLDGGRRGEAIVAAAGPLSNLVLAAAVRSRCATCSRTRSWLASCRCSCRSWFCSSRSTSLLMIFNLIPIPPLDGSKVLFAFLDRRTEYQIRPFLEQYGFFILLALLFLPPGNSIGGRIIIPILDALFGFLVGV